MNNDNRIYWVALHSNGRPIASFCGNNAKRDAMRASPKVRRMTGAEWDQLAKNASR